MTIIQRSIEVAAQLVVLAAIFVPLERLFTLRRERILRRQFWVDIGYYFLNTLGLATLMALPLAALATAANALVPSAVRGAVGQLPLWAGLPLAIVIGDIGAYWGHRWSHRWPFLWRFHVIHHSPTHVDWLVNTRAHPVDLVFTRVVGLMPLFALGFVQPGASVKLPALYSTLLVVWSFVIHANVRWRFGWLEYLFATPAFHHWHHTNDEMRDHNFAAIFPFIDKIFGSFHLPKDFPKVYGVDAPPRAALWAQLVDPLVPTRTRFGATGTRSDAGDLGTAARPDIPVQQAKSELAKAPIGTTTSTGRAKRVC